MPSSNPQKIPKVIGGIARAKASYSPAWQGGEVASAAFDTTTGRLLVDSLSSMTADASGNAISGGQVKRTDNLYSPTLFRNNGANATLNVKATPGNVFSVFAINTNAAVRFLQLWDTTTVANTGTLFYSFPLPANSGSMVIGSDFFTQEGVYFPTGIAFGISTAFGSYVAATASEHFTAIQYK